MQYQFFIIPCHDPAEAQAELNAFLRSRRILSVQRQFAERQGCACWYFSVEYLQGNGVREAKDTQRPKVDYKEVLSPEDFAAYGRLREVRKQLANAEGVPVYAVFTNEQLAAMVQAKVTSAIALGRLEGVGEARVKKYGEAFLKALAGAAP